MFGPVFDASHTPRTVASALWAELLGVLFVYLAISRVLKDMPSSFSRKVNVFIFGGLGICLVSVSLVELRRTGVVFALALGLFLGGFEFSRWRRFRGSDSWPTTQGIIESVEVKEVRTRSSHYFAVDAAYSYSISGEYYSGRFTKTLDTESEADDYAERLKAARILLRYNPEKIDCSRVEA